jgi:MFS transporter, CP family, cyanate transporter
MTATQDRPDTASIPTGRRGLVGLYIGVGLMLVALNLRIGVASVGPVLTAIEHGLGVSSSAASLLTTIPVFAFGAFAFLTPSLTKRVGVHRLLGVTMLVVTGGIAIRMVPSMWALFGGTVLLGAAIAVGNVLMPAAIKQDFAHRVGLMMGLYSTALFVGAAVASAFTVPLLTAFGGWRPALGFWALPAVLALVVWLPRALRRTAPPRPAATPGSTAPAGTAPAGTAPAGPATASAIRDEPSIARLLRDPVAWAVTATMGLQSLSYYAALTWIPTILQDAGMSAHNAGLMLSYSAFPGVVGALVTPVVAKHVRPGWLLGALSVVLCAAGFVGLLVAPAAAPWVWMTLLGLGQGGAISLSLSYIVLRSPDSRHTAHLSTMAQGVGYLFAGLGPLGLGVLHAVTGGWTVPIVALLVLLVVQLVTGVAASRDRHVLAPRG